MRPEVSGSRSVPLGVVGRTLLGAYMIVLSILLGYLVYALWPIVEPDASGKIPPSLVELFGAGFTVSAEVRLILLVMAVGALGSYVHTATSFGDFVGNRRMYRSWAWWYILRPSVGFSLALIFYFVIRGGLLSAGADAGEINPFGIAAVSGLVGLFAKQATDKLRELFDTLFKTEKPDQRGDQLNYPVPGNVTIDPPTAPVGRDLTLMVTGNGFVPESVVRFNGVDRPTTFVSDTRLTVQIPSLALAAPGDAQVTVINPPPGGGISNAATLRII